MGLDSAVDLFVEKCLELDGVVSSCVLLSFVGAARPVWVAEPSSFPGLGRVVLSVVAGECPELRYVSRVSLSRVVLESGEWSEWGVVVASLSGVGVGAVRMARVWFHGGGDELSVGLGGWHDCDVFTPVGWTGEVVDGLLLGLRLVFDLPLRFRVALNECRSVTGRVRLFNSLFEDWLKDGLASDAASVLVNRFCL